MNNYSNIKPYPDDILKLQTVDGFNDKFQEYVKYFENQGFKGRRKLPLLAFEKANEIYKRFYNEWRYSSYDSFIRARAYKYRNDKKISEKVRDKRKAMSFD